jgi:hypothetical protein
MTTLEVEVVQLQSNDGTRYKVGDFKTDEITVTINGAACTVASLKREILLEFFPGKSRSVASIKVFSCPEGEDTAQLWVARAPKEALEENKSYGFIDLVEQDGEFAFSYSFFVFNVLFEYENDSIFLY